MVKEGERGGRERREGGSVMKYKLEGFTVILIQTMLFTTHENIQLVWQYGGWSMEEWSMEVSTHWLVDIYFSKLTPSSSPSTDMIG